MNEKLQQLIDIARESTGWFGAAIESMPTALSVIMAFPRELIGGESYDAMEFYRGNQWPAEQRELRAGHMEGSIPRPARPCLVVNRLPELVAAALDHQREDGLPDLSALELTKLEIIITMQNRDAQMFYNYTLSSYVEFLQMQHATSGSSLS